MRSVGWTFCDCGVRRGLDLIVPGVLGILVVAGALLGVWPADVLWGGVVTAAFLAVSCGIDTGCVGLDVDNESDVEPLSSEVCSGEVMV